MSSGLSNESAPTTMIQEQGTLGSRSKIPQVVGRELAGKAGTIGMLLRRYGVRGLVRYLWLYLRYGRLREDFSFFAQGYRKAEPRVTTKHGYKLYLHRHDRGISKELFCYGEHEPGTTTLVKRTVRPGMTVLDIGSNLGYYAILEAELVGPTGRVIAIEPDPGNFTLLGRNIELNDIRNVTLIEGAIGNRDGEADLFISEFSNTHSMHPRGAVEASGTLQVKMRSADSLRSELCLEQVGLVRMDIEGYEVEALKGMHVLLSTLRPSLLVEVHCEFLGAAAITELLNDLASIGYQPSLLVDRDRDYPWMSDDHRVERVTMESLQGRLSHHRVATVLFTTSSTDDDMDLDAREEA